MATTQQKREWWADWRCNPLQMDAVAFPGVDRDWHLPVADAAVPAFELFAGLMQKHDYLFREVSGGTYNCRYIGGTTSWSLHAYGIAIDLNPSKNPFGTKTHNFPQDFIEEVMATGLFRWGYVFSDPMHWEIDVPPEEIQDMAFTVKQEQILANIADRLDALGSDGSHVTYLIPDMRKNLVTMDELSAILSSSGTVDEVARKLAKANAEKLKRIKDAI